MFNQRHLLGIEPLRPEEITHILETADSFREISERSLKKVPTLRGKTVVNLFLEPSTRTRSAFSIAEKRLSADTIDISGSTSSIVKGETLLDTARNLEAMRPDIIVMRHPVAGACHFLAEYCTASIINAGDGAHEHPTQALLDAMTILDHKEKIEGLKVGIVGDITYSRVARSNIHLLTKLGASVTICGPATMMPLELEKLAVTTTHRVDEAIEEADVIMILRIQRERQHHATFPSAREYFEVFGVNTERLEKAKDDVIIMHPGPLNRGVEIAPEVADGPYSVILEQVTNGVAVRMATLYLLIGEEPSEPAD